MSVRSCFTTLPGFYSVYTAVYEPIPTSESESPEMPVILFQPLFEERKNAKRALFCFTEILTKKKYRVFSFDYPNTGESLNDGNPIDLEKIFLASLAFSKSCIQRSHHRDIMLLGLRFGASIAARVARQLSDDDDTLRVTLLLISPVMSGNVYSRQIKQRRVLRHSISTGNAQTSSSFENDYDGYLISDFTFNSFNNFDILNTLRGFKTTPSILLLNVGHKNNSDDPLAAAFSDIPGVIKTVAFRFPPFWERIGDVDLSPLCTQFEQFL